MRNAEAAGILEELAAYEELLEEPYKAQAYRRAAGALRELAEDVEALHADERLQDIPGVGEAISSKLTEYLDTGSISKLEEHRASVPVDLPALLSVQGLGVKRVRTLHEELGIATLEDLEEAANTGRIQEVAGFGPKTQESILQNLQVARRGRDRTLRSRVEAVAEGLQRELEALDACSRVDVVGSYRRGAPTVGDLDLLAEAEHPEAVVEGFTGLPALREVREAGGTKASGLLTSGLQVDLRVVEPEAYGAARLYFTGSKEHNVQLRDAVKREGRKLNEYGLWEDGERVSAGRGDTVAGSEAGDGGAASVERVAGASEEDVYEAMGLPWIPPEMREDVGVIEHVREHGVPDLLTVEDMRGDLQMHTTWSDGATDVQAMAEKARDLGYGYILVTDHGPSLTVTGGPDEAALREQRLEVDAVNDAVDGVTVLQGVEANIQPDGSLDISDAMCEELDLVVASLHTRVDDATERILSAIRNHPVDIIAHPTNRRLGQRDGNELGLESIAEAAQEHRVALEVNAQPDRLDLPWRDVHRLRDRVRFVVSTDAHSPRGMEAMHRGVTQARKGWLTPEHVINTRPLDELLAWFRP